MLRTPRFDLIAFQHRLGEAMAWYLAKAPITDPEHGLRTAALRPPTGLETPTERESGDPPRGSAPEIVQDYFRRVARSRPQALKERCAIVDAVADQRRALLSTPRLAPPQMTELLSRSRLLTYNPDDNLSDGAAPIHSARYFDDENVPPWDTWLVYVADDISEFKSYLLAWVPPECLELASAGIESNPEECICWAEDVDAMFVRHLRTAGLLR